MAKKDMKTQVDTMDSPERLEQLEKIDRLREFGVGEEINLPQLVVVGDQSSGKSSLLEVSIIPAADADDVEKKELELFSRSMTDFSANTFANVLDEAAVCMGLPRTGASLDSLEKRFSNNVLKIEISGPQQSHLSFVDVPGLFHNPTKYQTAEDRLVIRELIEGYVKDRRTIIMAVMDARNNLANQEVFRIAKAADKEGSRTVGIMTKCDALQKGDEPVAIRIAQNVTEKLTHGWFCVRNRSTDEILSGVTIEQRHEIERAFFRTVPWKVLDKTRVGIASLKAYLSRLLSDHVTKEFPEIRKEIDNRYVRLSKELQKLGVPRQTTQEQMQFLIRLAGDYQKKVEDSLTGRYFKTGRHPSKLRMHVQMSNEAFNKQIHSEGCHYAFQSTEKTLDDALKAAEGVEVLDFSEPVEGANAEDEKGADSDIDDSNENIYIAIHTLYITSRGTELPGHVNPSVLEALFARQTVNWVWLAEGYVEDVVSLIKSCNETLFAQLPLDDSLRGRLLENTRAGTEISVQAAKDDLSRILNDERTGPLMTNNHYFADNLAAARAERVVVQLKKMGYQDGQQYEMRFESLTRVAHLSNEASAVHDIHDTLSAYYKVALKRFIDNVVIQVVERNLLGPGGPLTIFSPDWVGGLKSDELAAIAGEDYITSNNRTELSAQLVRLEQARKICSGRY